jgi:hypothetical protein
LRWQVQNLSESKWSLPDFEDVAMDLFCNAIRPGAISGPKWLAWRTMLAKWPTVISDADFLKGYALYEYKESGFPDGGHNAAHVIGRGLRARRRSLFSTGARRSDAPRRPPAHISSSIMA